MNIADTFHGISTLIQTDFQGNQIAGSGFFYEELAETDPTKTGYYWREVKETWLVTNRHVLLPKIDEHEHIPDRIIFYYGGFYRPLRNITKPPIVAITNSTAEKRDEERGSDLPP